MERLTAEEQRQLNSINIKLVFGRVPVAARISPQVYLKIRKWSNDNNFPVTWVINRAMRDFITNYIEKGIIPTGERVNLGALSKKPFDNENEF